MPLKVARRLGYHKYQAYGISLVIADRSVRLRTWMLEDLPLRIGNVEIPTDFIVLEMDEDTMRKPTIEGQLFYIEEMDQLADELLEELALEDHLQVALTKDQSEGYLHTETEKYSRLLDAYRPVPSTFFIEKLDKTVCEVLAVDSTKNSIESGRRSSDSIEPDTGCKEQVSGDWSELKAPKVDLKPFPKSLRYVFLGENSTYPVIVNSELKPEQLDALIVELRKYMKAIGYTLDYIKGISPDLCIHRIHLNDETKSTIEPHRRLNPNLKEVVKKEILKLLDAGIIYSNSDSTWISLVHCVPKKGGIIVIKNDKEELIPTRTIVGHRMCLFGALWSTWDVRSKEGLCMELSSTAQLIMKKGTAFEASSINPHDPLVELGQTLNFALARPAKTELDRGTFQESNPKTVASL
ncbi:unnamed protein product [Microthlaspi erraticum]|uniref:Uncharacterized protein n=1 Tax=Microthlaspi erraticum TaxID=1685480 RepID=A0A6D2K781_9BRAS|nr:unnamed protein product [Microthlaspi erraticum]